MTKKFRVFLVGTLFSAYILKSVSCFPIDVNYFELFNELENETLSNNTFKLYNNFTNECSTVSCFFIQNIYKNQMNLSADPCDDFYRFSCGNFLEKNSYAASGVLEKLHIDFLRWTDEVLSEADTLDLVSIDNTKRFYNSCREQESLMFLKSSLTIFKGLTPLNNETEDSINNQTASNSSVSNSFDNLILMNRLGFDVLFELRIDINPFNTTQYTIWLERTSVISSIFEEIALHNILNELFKSKQTNWTSYVDDLSEIASQFEQIELNEPLKEVPKHDQITIKDLNEKIPHFNWSSFLVDGVFKNDFNFTLNDDQLIIHNDLDYLFTITKLFSNLSIEKENQLNDLLIWTFIISDLGPYKYFQFNYAPFNLSITSSEEELQQQSQQEILDSNIKFGSGHCLSFTSELMKFTIARLLASKYFIKLNTPKEKIKEIVDNVKNEFILTLKNNEWMDSHTKNVSLDKINEMEIKIGYPDFIFDDQILDQIYAEFKFGYDFFDNLLKLRGINLRENIKMLMNPVNKTIWKSNPFDVNAYYYPLFNQIYLSAGLLVSPIFDSSVPNYLNYGSLGTIIGHEIIHGFDSNGRFYDKTGTFYSDDTGNLWNNESILIYENRTQCLVDQFNDFFKTETNKSKTNGQETLAENIADNMGLQVSYKAFKKWSSEQKEAELPLRGFESFSPDQMFFISYGQIWCEANTYSERLTSKTYHSPHSFRVNGAVSNFDQFYKAFNCKKKNSENNVCKLF